MAEMKSIIIGVVTLVVALTLISALMPSTITTVSNTTAISGYSASNNTTGWSSGAQDLWETLGLFASLAALLVIIGIALKSID